MSLAPVAGLPDVIQLGALYRRSLVLLVSAREAEGQVVIEGGEILHACWGDLSGEDALYAMLACADVQFQSVTASDLYPSLPRRTIHAEPQQLLLEAARRQDEGTLLRPRRRNTLDTGPSSTPVPESDSRARRRPHWNMWVLAGVLLALLTLAAFSRRTASTPVTRDAGGAATSQGTPIEISALAPTDRRPKLLSGKPPVRPRTHLALSPTIVLRLLIDRGGRVAQAAVYQSRPELAAFEQAALEAARAYHFSPAMQGGQPVAVSMNWSVIFTSREAAASRIQVKGSDTIGGTVGPELAAAFLESTGVDVKFEALGSATAFGGLFDGTAAIGASSRSVNADELAEAQALGIELKEFVVGYDGVAVITHPKNPVTALTLAELAALFSGEITDWGQLRDGTAGGVAVCSRPAYSGTHEFVQGRVLGQRADSARRQFVATRRVLEKSEQLVEAVGSDPAAIGYVGLGYVKSGVRAIPLRENASAPAVAPEASSVRDGTYPVYRPLLMYTSGPPTGAVAAFLRFVLSARGQSIVEKHGFIAGDAEGSTPVVEDDLGMRATVRSEVHRVLFRHRSVRLDAQALGTLAEISAELVQGRSRALIVGNSDLQGSQRANSELAQQRAELVAANLRASGVPSELLEVEAMSDQRPLASNGTRAGRDLNRRVDVYLVRR
jgi:phosphate transport system substrate-binding protein